MVRLERAHQTVIWGKIFFDTSENGLEPDVILRDSLVALCEFLNVDELARVVLLFFQDSLLYYNIKWLSGLLLYIRKRILFADIVDKLESSRTD